jgi:hypothetical protein
MLSEAEKGRVLIFEFLSWSHSPHEAISLTQCQSAGTWEMAAFLSSLSVFSLEIYVQRTVLLRFRTKFLLLAELIIFGHIIS